MKYSLIILKLLYLFLALISFEAKGQSLAINDSTYYNNLSFIITGGITFAPVTKFTSNYTVTQGEESVLHRVCDINTSVSYQFSIGAEYQLNRKLSIQSGISYLINKMTLDYQQRNYSASQAWYASTKGSFEQNQFYFKIPLALAYSLGKKVKWQVGTGLYWLHTNKIYGSWVNFRVDDARAETCETPLMPDDHDGGEDIVLLWKTNNLGALLQARVSIPISWNIEVLFGSQYHRPFNILSAPSISRSPFILETGFRFKFKYDRP